ncbi:dynein heavy chain, partial [Kipferlia bialata]
ALPQWLEDLQARVKQLQNWSTDLNVPPSVWLSGLFNPQSLLRAVLQATARANQWPLDKMFLSTEVSKKNLEEITSAPRDGAYIHGLFMEGARYRGYM